MGIASLGVRPATACLAAIVALAPQALAKEQHKETRQLTATHVQASPVSASTANGSISIRAYDGDEVRVTARLVSKSAQRLADARVVARRADEGRLEIECLWPGGKPKSGDGCAFEILVPDARGVAADTSNGSITIAGLSGKLVADTSNGSISVEGHDGPVHADTSNGSISARDVTGRVDADTSNGSISVALTDANPGPVHLDTSNGAITLEVGPGFAGSLHADTSVGRLNIGPFPEQMSVEIAERGKTSCRAIFGGKDGPKSVLDTSVGSVTIRARS